MRSHAPRCGSQFRLLNFEMGYSASLKLEHASGCAKKLASVCNAWETVSCMDTPTRREEAAPSSHHTSMSVHSLVPSVHRARWQLLFGFHLVKPGDHAPNTAVIIKWKTTWKASRTVTTVETLSAQLLLGVSFIWGAGPLVSFCLFSGQLFLPFRNCICPTCCDLRGFSIV